MTTEAPILATAGEPSGAPGISHEEEGDFFVGMVFDYEHNVDRRDSDGPVLKDDGTPKKVCIVHLIVMGAAGQVHTGKQADPQPVKEGDLVRYFADGHNLYAQDRDVADHWSGAMKAHGSLRVGDIVKVTLRNKTNVGSNGRSLSQPKKIKSHLIRPHKPEEAALYSRALQAREARHEASVAAAPVLADAAPSGNGAAYDPSKDPF